MSRISCGHFGIKSKFTGNISYGPSKKKIQLINTWKKYALLEMGGQFGKKGRKTKRSNANYGLSRKSPKQITTSKKKNRKFN